MDLLFVTKPTFTEVSEEAPQTYVGTWKSAGGFIRHELLPDGRYVKQRGRRPAVSGRYQIEGERIAYESDEGRTYEGVFANGALRQADMLFYKVNSPDARGGRFPKAALALAARGPQLLASAPSPQGPRCKPPPR